MKLIGLLVMVAMLSTALAYPDNITVSQDNVELWQQIDKNVSVGDVINIDCVYGPMSSYSEEELKHDCNW